MKKTTVWLLGIVMAFSFLGLLYLQISYIEEMVKMRNEQFDEAVKRSLMAASKEVEAAEVERWVREDISEAEKEAYESTQTGQSTQTSRVTMTAPDGSRIELKTITTMPGEVPRAIISHKHGSRSISQASRTLVDAIKNRYLYQRSLVDDVVWQMIYKASNKPIADRVNFKNLDRYIGSGLIDNGVELKYHFRVIDQNGTEVYRCSDYTDAGSESTYTQPLFTSDPPARMSVVKVHFPGKRDYIYDSVSFMIPSVIFTLVLLVTFTFTLYIIFRQKKLTEMKNDFINNMTHEFKTPISSISLAAQMLGDPSVNKSPAMFAQLSNIISSESKRLHMQVEKVLQMSLFDRQRSALKLRDVDVNALIDDVVHTNSLKVESAGGRVDTDLSATHPLVAADEMHLTNVVFNLMENAMKYRRPDVDLHLSIRTWNNDAGNRLMIAVADNGIGIKKGDLKKVFERFYRVHTGNLHDVKGFGLGLAYVKKIIHDHKGTIRAESEIGAGTTFIISLPTIKTE